MLSLLCCLLLLGQPEQLREPPRPVPQIGGPTARAQLAAWLAGDRFRFVRVDVVSPTPGEISYRVRLDQWAIGRRWQVTTESHDLDAAIAEAIHRWSVQDWDKVVEFTSIRTADDWTPAEMPTPPDGWRPLDLPTRPDPEQVRPSPQPRGGYYSPPRYYTPPSPFGGGYYCPPGGG